MLRALVLALVVVSGVTLLTCKGRSSEPSTNKIKIVATIPPLADFAHEVGGARVQVTSLLPPGASPHTFEPTPSLAKAAERADLIILVGLDADHWVQGLLPKDVPVVTAAELEGIELISGDDHHHEHEENQGANPHVWLDPLYAGLVCSAIADELSKIDPQDSQVYHENLETYLAKLDSLHALIQKTVEAFPSKKYVSFHPAWSYFARRYGLEEAAVISRSPGKEPTPRHLEEVIAAIRESGARAVFAEPQLSPKAAEVIADEAGVEVLYLDPLGRENEGYIDLMNRNLTVLKGAMGEK
jgi:zinc transport system substrate-binding protein